MVVFHVVQANREVLLAHKRRWRGAESRIAALESERALRPVTAEARDEA
jgi:hypothetical protein